MDGAIGGRSYKLTHMGKTGDAIKAVTGVAIVAASLDNPFDACRNVSATDCPTLAPEHHYTHGNERHVAIPEQPTAAGGDLRPTGELSAIKVTVIEP